MRKLIFLSLVLLSCVGCVHAQKYSNWHWAVEYQGPTVAARVTAAQTECQAVIPCIIVIDSVLAGYTEGTLPARCAACTWYDYRTPGSPVIVNGGTGGGNGSVTSVAVTVPTDLRIVSGSPVTTAGTIALDWSLSLAPTFSNTPNTIVRRDNSGNFSAGQITAGSFVGNGAGTWTGPVAGNASTASALTNTPTQCSGSTPMAQGIQASGNANCAAVTLSSGVTGTVGRGNGGTGHTVYTDGQVLIGNSSTGNLDQTTLTAGSGVTITNGNGSISIASTGGGAQARGVPTTIPDLVMWYEADQYTTYYGNSSNVPFIPELAGGVLSLYGVVNQGSFATNDINGLPSIVFDGTNASKYEMLSSAAAGNNNGAGPILGRCTIFVVFKPTTSLAVNHEFISGSASTALDFITDSSGHFELVQQNTAIIGTSTNTLTLNTWVQANVTYDSVTGAYAFRAAKAAAGSGTNAKAISAKTNSVGWNKQTDNEYANYHLAAMLVYQRVLTGGEITTIETYFAKYGL